MITHDLLIKKNMGNRSWFMQEGSIQSELGLEKNQMKLAEFFHHMG